MKKAASPLLRAEKPNGSRLQEDLIDQKRLLIALTAFKRGDFSVRLPDDWTGIAGKIADTFNDVIETKEKMSHELERISLVVGKQGRISQRASLGDVTKSWSDSICSVSSGSFGT